MFITFEGIEGVGKTTQLKLLAQYLEKSGISVFLTREPGGTELGEEVRDVLLKHRKEGVLPLTELLLMFAVRAEHIHKVIKPALQRGQWVLCDRFVDASYAYQGGGRGIPIDEIAILEELVLGDFHPDYTFLLDAPIEISLKRVDQRGTKDRFERENLNFFEKVRLAYGLRAQMNSKRYKIIDASRALDLVQKDIIKIVDEILIPSKTV